MGDSWAYCLHLVVQRADCLLNNYLIWNSANNHACCSQVGLLFVQWPSSNVVQLIGLNGSLPYTSVHATVCLSVCLSVCVWSWYRNLVVDGWYVLLDLLSKWRLLHYIMTSSINRRLYRPQVNIISCFLTDHRKGSAYRTVVCVGVCVCVCVCVKCRCIVSKRLNWSSCFFFVWELAQRTDTL